MRERSEARLRRTISPRRRGVKNSQQIEVNEQVGNSRPNTSKKKKTMDGTKGARPGAKAQKLTSITGSKKRSTNRRNDTHVSNRDREGCGERCSVPTRWKRWGGGGRGIFSLLERGPRIISKRKLVGKKGPL